MIDVRKSFTWKVCIYWYGMCGGSGKYKTFLGAARGSAAAGMFKEFTGRDIRFFELIKYMFLIG